MPKSFETALATLHARHVDAKAGFDVMVDRAKPGFKPVATRFRDFHAEQARAIAALLPEGARKDGSFMSTVNRTVVRLRDIFDELDEHVMKHIRSGEEWVHTAYLDAIELAPPDARAVLVDGMVQLETLIADTRRQD
ncbi:DUF2383 domain-containing protein [Pseudaestuariivita atlantica]|uniref:DUF2383 domain-containing protein n=1 Tax=Pseudaestuariivita atlantica TaxID=1317121 RepID=A0A0L1JV82_9RHOB|nr:DUF2383 domain-containing protein [Pseudaestuariivita atlantica]KNG95602.1 hypothetical protein ATO11_03210 [Pseudaestuariivita atlantica]